jgi:hypothetical protein
MSLSSLSYILTFRHTSIALTEALTHSVVVEKVKENSRRVLMEMNHLEFSLIMDEQMRRLLSHAC